MGDRQSEARQLGEIAWTYDYLGEKQQALVYYNQALSVTQTAADRGWEAGALRMIGDLHNNMGEKQKALDYYTRLLQLSREISNRSGEAYALQIIGQTYNSMGEHQKALDRHQESLSISRAAGDGQVNEVFILYNIGSTYDSRGEKQKALDYFDQARALWKDGGAQWGDVGTRFRLAVTERNLGNLIEARAQIEAVLDTIETVRAEIASEELRTSYFATVQQYYEFYIDLLMRLDQQRSSEGHAAAALHASERARARSLLETLTEARADIRQGVDAVLLQRERTLQQQLNARAAAQVRLLKAKYTEEQATALKKEVAALTAEYQQLRALIRQKSPRYAALTQPVPLNLKEIQEQALDPDTLLLEYALGEEKSYLWAVTQTSINSYRLPKRSEIESQVRRAVSLLSDGKQWSTSDKVESEFAEVAGRLSRMLLDPVAALLPDKRLLIVGDGALQYLPFGALPSPKSKVQNPVSTNGQKARPSPLIRKPLIVDYEIVSLPSASTLAVLRRETANRARPAKSIAVLADPVFEENDERVQLGKAQSGQNVGPQNTPAVRDASLEQTSNPLALLERAFQLDKTGANGGIREALRITRLPFTRFEAEGILAAAPPGQSLKATDFRANRETATGAELAQYRFVHFATHGILNSEHPELSGIVLSLVNEQGQPVDGFLRLHEIYNLQLSADMVVLSACQTGLGKEIRGEGLVGLTRGFMYAGSPRVVASLWKVDDAATAELMKRFYQGMLKDNLRPAAALRRAKVEMWKQKRWSAPFYWAAFELQGEWK